MDDPALGEEEREQMRGRAEIHRQFAHSMKVLRLILRDAMNELERQGPAFAMELDQGFVPPPPAAESEDDGPEADEAE